MTATGNMTTPPLTPGSLALWNGLLCRVVEVRGDEATVKRPDLYASTALVRDLKPVKEIMVGRDTLDRPVLYADEKWECFLPSPFQLLDPQTLRLPNDPPDPAPGSLLADIKLQLEKALQVTTAGQLRDELLIRGLRDALKQAKRDKDVECAALRALVESQDKKTRELFDSHVKAVQESGDTIQKLRAEKDQLTAENARLQAYMERYLARYAEWKDLVSKLDKTSSEAVESIRVCQEWLK